MLWELTPAHEAMMDEQDDIRAMEGAAQKEMRRIAARQYPGVGNWDADLIRKLSDRIYRAVEHFALDTSNIAYEAEQRMVSGKPASKSED